jgi:Dot/Icm secretion system protein IcmQ
MKEQAAHDLTNHTAQHNKMQRNIHLTELINKNTQLMNDARHDFEHTDGTNSDKIKLNQRLIDLMEEIFGSCDWESSLLLHNIKSELQEHMDTLLEQREQLLEIAAPATTKLATLKPNQRVIYVTLYQVDGYSMPKWSQRLSSLERYNLSRPVYGSEEEVQKALRSRGYPVTEAYVSVIVDKDMVRSLDNPAKDRWGQELISLKEKAVKQSNILQFVHSHKHYNFVDNALVEEE